jgi:DNA-directed RNA polymerase alpha subunit
VEGDRYAGNSLVFLDVPEGDYRSLYDAGIRGTDFLATWTEKELLGVRGIGPKSIIRIKEALEKWGLSLKEG